MVTIVVYGIFSTVRIMLKCKRCGVRHSNSMTNCDIFWLNVCGVTILVVFSWPAALIIQSKVALSNESLLLLKQSNQWISVTKELIFYSVVQSQCLEDVASTWLFLFFHLSLAIFYLGGKVKFSDYTYRWYHLNSPEIDVR